VFYQAVEILTLVVPTGVFNVVYSFLRAKTSVVRLIRQWQIVVRRCILRFRVLYKYNIGRNAYVVMNITFASF
jgi:hypothetical protein